MEIQFENLVWKIRWKFSLEIIDGNLVGNLDPWKFSFKIQMEIQFGKLVEILERNLHRIFDPWNF